MHSQLPRKHKSRLTRIASRLWDESRIRAMSTGDFDLAISCSGGKLTRKLRSPKKKRWELEYIVVGDVDSVPGNEENKREPTM